MRPPWECHRQLLAVVSLLCVALLILPVPFALAVAVDPTWIPGLYDNGDYDEVVDTLLSAEVIPASLKAVARPVKAHDPVPTGVERECVTYSFDVAPSRAPPLT